MFSFMHLADCGLKNLPYGGINPETGLNRRFEDVEKNFSFCVATAIKNKCKYFVIAGDINEERNPESLLIERFSSHVADLISEGIRVIIVAGNHDVDSSKGTSTSISFLKSLGLLDTYISDLRPSRFEFSDVVFHCVPYMFPHQVMRETNDEVSEWLKTYINGVKLSPDKKNILVTHYSLETTFYGLGVDEPVLDIDCLSRFDYVALGHIHKYEMFSSFTGGYTGSMFTKDFGEENMKFVNHVVVGHDVHIKKVQIPERRFIQIDIDGVGVSNTDLMDILSGELDKRNVSGCVLKVRVKAKKRFNPKIVYAMLKNAGVFHYVPIDWKIDTNQKVKKLTTGDGVVGDVDIVDGYYKQKPDNIDTRDYVIDTIGKWDDVFLGIEK